MIVPDHWAEARRHHRAGKRRITVRRFGWSTASPADATAKPWRIGIASHLRPRPGIWPVAPSKMPLRTSWVAAYEARASQFASCRYVDTLGSGVVHHRIQSVVDLHDRESRCHDPGAKLA